MLSPGSVIVCLPYSFTWGVHKYLHSANIVIIQLINKKIIDSLSSMSENKFNSLLLKIQTYN